MANIFSVSNADELQKALEAAEGGDTIELAGGDYGKLSLWDGKQEFIKYGAPVTITSSDSDDLASFSRVVINGGKNIVFDNVIFDYQFSSNDGNKYRPFEIKGSEDVTIKNSVFLGDVVKDFSETRDDFGSAFGLSVRGSSNITVEGNEFTTWDRGALFSNINGLVVRDNNVHDMRSDGMNFVSVRSALIENNHLHNFRDHEDSNAHRDFIQFWTNGTDMPSTDIVIRGNILDIGEGSWTQSIFMRNEEVDTGRAGEEMFYRNILIEDNAIYNAHGHGITIGETDGLTIRNNSVLRAEGEMHGNQGSVTVPKINLKPGSQNVFVEDNIVSAIAGFEGQPDWNMTGNALIQPADYLEHFVTSSLATTNRAHNFIALPDGVIESLQAGSSRTLQNDAPEEIIPQFQVESSTENSHALIFDAALTMGPLGMVTSEDAEFIWTFGDGSTATGSLVQHTFGDPGYYNVSLKVRLKDGTTAQTDYEVGVSGDGILSFDQQSGQFQALGYGTEMLIDSNSNSLLQTDDGMVVRLGGEGLQASVSRSNLSKLSDADNFELSMTLKANPNGEPWGEVVRFHQSFGIHVDKDGNLRLNLYPEDGSRARLASEGVKLNDGSAYDITIRYDGTASEAQIIIDGELAGSAAVSGPLGGGGWDLMFGNPHGKKNFEGELSAFTLSAESLDFPSYDGETETVPDSSPTTLDGDRTTTDIPENEKPSETDDPDTSTGDESVPEEDSGVLEPLLHGGYGLDFSSARSTDTIELHDDAHIVDTLDGQALSFDGKKDHASLGRLKDFEDSQRISFSVDFTSENSSGMERLVWNHQKIGLALIDDGFVVHVGNNEKPFWKGLKIEGLDIHDGSLHNATVMVDAETDRFQFLVDDVLVVDDQDTDFDFVGAGGHEWGWSLGTAWNRWFEGNVHEFQVSDNFDFVESTPVQEESLLLT